MSYSLVEVAVDREARRAVLTLSGPSHVAPDTIEMAHAEGADFYLFKAVPRIGRCDFAPSAE